jgi:hypothetical protein
VTEMRPDPDSDLAGAESEYGDDSGFAAEATRATSPEVTTPAGTGDDSTGDDSTGDDSAGLTAEDDHPGDGAD